MQGKQVGYVLIAIILLGAAGLVARLLSTEAQVPVITGVRPLNAEVIDKVVLRDWESEVFIEKKPDGTWWTEGYPVFQNKLELFWDTAAKLKSAELVALNRENHDVMGVSPQFGTVVEFWEGDSLRDQFIVGDKQFVAKSEETAFFLWSVAARRCYLRHHDSNEVYAIYCEFPDMFDTRLRRWKYSLVADIPSSDVEAFTFSYPNDAFDVRLIESVWVVQDGDVAEQAVQTEVHGMLRAIDRGVATTAFPTAEETAELDWSNPDILMGVGTKPGSASKSVLLLFLKKEGEGKQGGYYVKGAENNWVHFLDNEDVAALLKSRSDLLGVEGSVEGSSG